ncbi:spore coat protein [Ruminococcaceae bacterium OttesenSCG-928-N02]|nr:spore coat protein [Ruminococcaceae bacterium OttesenSCG-928-N02]
MPKTTASKAQQTMEDKDIMKDALNNEKYNISGYNTFTTECATPAVRTDVMAVYNSTLKIQDDIFKEMFERGWYKVPPAEQKKITTAKQQLTAG